MRSAQAIWYHKYIQSTGNGLVNRTNCRSTVKQLEVSLKVIAETVEWQFDVNLPWQEVRSGMNLNNCGYTLSLFNRVLQK